MAEGYGIFIKSDSGKSMRDEDLQEEDVWGIVNERENSSPKMGTFKDSSCSSARRVPRVIPRSRSEAKMAQQSSAPVNIPDWSKIYRKSGAKEGMSNNGSLMMVDYENGNADDVSGDYYDFVDDGDGDEMVPPHEYIARKLARSQISSFSMCEGIGRTLKGRDLSKVRNAVLTKTGFLE